MAGQSSSYRTDEELDAILNETGNWVIMGRLGQALGAANSLGHALDRAAEYAASGAVVIAVCRLPSDNIIVFPEQMARLRHIVAKLRDHGSRLLKNHG